jgi:uncharacterized protein
MSVLYKTPGVYVEEIVKFPPSIAPVETAIPAFIGYTEKAINDLTKDNLSLKPTRISSMVEYEEFFGFGPNEEKGIEISINTNKNGALSAVAKLNESERSKHIMYYAVNLFFANGGGPCYIVSVDNYSKDNKLNSVLLESGLNSLNTEDEPTLIIFPEAQGLLIDNFKNIHDAALQQCEKLKDRFVIMDTHGGAISLSESKSNLKTAVQHFRDNGVGNEHLKYGAAYAPNIEIRIPLNINVLKEENIIVQDIIVQENGEEENTPTPLNALKESNNQKYELAKKSIRAMASPMPPAAAVAGIYAAVDSRRGVWKAPANVSLEGVIRPTIQLSDKDQEDMNIDTTGKSVNAIRSFTGKGTLVWGARTLAGNDNEWRYVSVRRFFNFAEESIKKATEQFVFEPNDANTWVRVQAMIENFLTTLWRQGALQGIKTEHAFYVAVGLGKTMTALDILEGRMIIEIGMAVVRPAEFIILRFSHKMAES